MASDLKIDIDGSRLNIRVGVILRHKDKVVIEISTVGANSVIPGGRIKINEKSSDALIREVKEEMDFSLTPQKLELVKVFENFFNVEGKPFHEIYFLYDYTLSDNEFESISFEQNKDNNTTFFKHIHKSELEKYNLLPLELYDIIRK